MKAYGIILRGIGGLYEVRLFSTPDNCRFSAGDTVVCPARGTLRHEKLTPLPGDAVSLIVDESADEATPVRGKADGAPHRKGAKKPLSSASTGAADAGVMLSDILPRKNEFVRPPMANLTSLFITASAAEPRTETLSIDKLTVLAEYSDVEPVIVVTKADLDRERAETLCRLYRGAGYASFVVSAACGEGIDELRDFILPQVRAAAGEPSGQNAGMNPQRQMRADIDGSNSDTQTGGADPHAREREAGGETIESYQPPVIAFAGLSGAGKSTLCNALFPSLGLATAAVSRRLGRGRHTTRAVSLYPLSELSDRAAEGFLADTPGFSALDFEDGVYVPVSSLPLCFREFEPYIARCRYTKCTHTKEEGCAILEAAEHGEIARSRVESFAQIRAETVAKPEWERRKENRR
jgi:ribosome biogenesis GTPase